MNSMAPMNHVSVPLGGEVILCEVPPVRSTWCSRPGQRCGRDSGEAGPRGLTAPRPENGPIKIKAQTEDRVSLA
jgi:hypothetical protein